MGLELYEAEPAARAVWAEADASLAFALSSLAFHGPEDELQLTQNAQPALLAAGVAAHRVLTARGVVAPPAYLAGHSLGEYTALVAACCLRFSDAVRLVRRRGELMAEAGERSGGAMSAVIGLDADELAELCEREGVDVANYNSPDQSVISGMPDAVARAGEAARAAGARRIVPLAVSGAFHSRLMAPVAERFAEELASVEVAPPAVPVVGNVHAVPLETEAAVRAELLAQLYSPVRWVQTIEFLVARGVEHYIELGPGKVLAALVRKTAPGVVVESSDSLLVLASGT